jgi:hypothetical protein
MKLKTLVAYSAGVVTAPAWYWVFRKPLMDHVVTPALAHTLMSEEMDETVFNLMSARLDFQDIAKNRAKEIHQLKAQGHSFPEIAKIMKINEKAIRLVYRVTDPEDLS